MRSYVAFAVLLLMSIALIVLLVSRPRAPHEAPVHVVELEVDSGDGAPVDAGLAAVADAGADAEIARELPKPPLDRTLRVAALGWELLAPGVRGAALDAGAKDLTVELAAEGALAALEARLARGGADGQGADVAILPLPSLVVSYDRLRALEPEVFLVVGWSRGGEELRASPGNDLVRALGGEVKLASDGNDSSTFLGLFALDLAGVAPAHVHVVGAASAEAKAAPFAVQVRGGVADARRVILSTADASRLVPIVAVASHGALEAHPLAYKAWAAAWLEGIERAHRDAPTAARQLAAKQGAIFAAGGEKPPEAIVLVEKLGQIEAASLKENAEDMGLSGRGGVSLDALFQRDWQLARGAGLVTSPPPDRVPIASTVVATLAREAGPEKAIEKEDAGAPALPAAVAVTLAYKAPDGPLDERAFTGQVGFLAGVFERSRLRVTVRGGDKATRAAVQAARERFDLPALRLYPGQAVLGSSAGVIEILGAP